MSQSTPLGLRTLVLSMMFLSGPTLWSLTWNLPRPTGVTAQTLTFSKGGTSTEVSVAADSSAKTIAADISSSVSGLSASATTVATALFDGTAGGAADLIEINGVSLTVDLSGSATAQATAVKEANSRRDQSIWVVGITKHCHAYDHRC